VDADGLDTKAEHGHFPGTNIGLLPMEAVHKATHQRVSDGKGAVTLEEVEEEVICAELHRDFVTRLCDWITRDRSRKAYRKRWQELLLMLMSMNVKKQRTVKMLWM
jgi:3-oxoacyl-[acyl-carrier-protein] synthase III